MRRALHSVSLILIVCAGFKLHAQEALAPREQAVLAEKIESHRESPFDQPPVPVASAAADISSVPKRFAYNLRLTLRGVYDDNIYLQHANQISDFYVAIEPGISLGYGDIVGHDRNYVRLDYSPLIYLYAENSRANAFQHLVSLDSEYRFGRLTMDLGIGVQIRRGANPASLNGLATSNPGPLTNLDAGGNADVNVYSLNANLAYDLTGKTFLSGGLHFSADEYQSLISSRTFSGDIFINYTYSPKLTAGLGGTGGFNSSDSGNPDQTYEQLNLRLTYQLTGKISLNGSLGLEFRQFDDSADGVETNISPVFALNATYQPFDGTTISLSGDRHIQNSAVLQGQDFTTTNITASVRQRFLTRMYLGVVVGYENSSYFNTASGVNASREDNYFFVQPSVDVTLTNFWTAGVYYLHRQSDSSNVFYSFNDNQVGLRTSLTF